MEDYNKQYGSEEPQSSGYNSMGSKVDRKIDEAQRKANQTGVTDKIKGHLNEVIGEGKSKLGDILDNPKLKVKGETQKIKGKAQQTEGAMKKVLHDTLT